MEENVLPEPSHENESNGCVNCGNNNIVEGYPTRLCSNCRQLFIKFPIPLWTKVFASAVGLVLLFGLFTFPKNLSLGMHLEKGKQYEHSKQYRSAQSEFLKVIESVPNNVDAKGHLMIAAFYNLDFGTFAKMGFQLQKVSFEDNSLLDRLNDLTGRFNEYVPDDTLENVLNEYDTVKGGVPESVYQTYLSKHPENIYCLMLYAGVIYDKENFAACDSLLHMILIKDDEYIPALRLLASSLREEGKWDESIKACDKILQVNNDEAYAIASKARVFLKQKKDKMALDLALESVEKDKSDPFNTATLALAYHFNNQPEKRDAIIKEAKAHIDSTQAYYMQYAIDVIEQKEKFRN